ncbi:MAG TPA: amidohydrolase [Gemmatimonadales bacterium]|nr:amidohydrolase [Gemmatimonadales bacterium]
MNGLLRARQIMTLHPAAFGDAVWWQDGRVRAVGRATELERRVPTRVPRFDLPGALVTPGFVDGHTHFAMWARARRQVHLAGAATRREALDRVASGSPENGWIVGHGWDANRWTDPPDRAALDRATSLPAYLESIDIHAAWVNTPALLAAGITRETPDPPGGRIVRDAAGEPTGLLLEHATRLVSTILPAGSPEDLVTLLRTAQRDAHRLGITGIHDVEGLDAHRAFRTLEAEDALRLRVLFSPPVAHLPTLLAHGAKSGQGSDWLRLGGVKLFLDGSLGSRTAWMLEAYEDGRDRGMPLCSEDEARAVVNLAAGGGIACAIHAIGDAAVRRALDLLKAAPRAPLPHRIEHLQCVHPADLPRAAAAGIVASMQPGHLPGDVELAESRWGGRSRGAYAFRSLLDAGTHLAFGSDVPVVSIDPRAGVAAAMTRVDPGAAFPHGWHAGERLSFEEAVRAYTLGNARAAGVGERRGTLAPGQDADLVAWEIDEPGSFADARVDLTVVGGEVVYRRE